MRYGIVINLDYDNHPYDTVKALFWKVRDGMLAAGFRQEGRVFTIEMPRGAACDLAQNVVDSIEQHQALDDSRIYRYIKEFYGFEFSKAVNLLVPSSDDIGVVEFAIDALAMLEGTEVIDLTSPRKPKPAVSR